MKRLLLCALLIVFFVLMRPTPAFVAPDKPSSPWQLLDKDSQVLRLWEAGIGPAWPQIAILQLSDTLQADLQRDPLAFYEKYQIFKPSKSDHEQGHAVFRLVQYAAGEKDPSFAVAVHDSSTYSAFASFQVGKVTQLDAKAAARYAAPNPGSAPRP
jgi:hypothetical protein